MSWAPAFSNSEETKIMKKLLLPIGSILLLAFLAGLERVA